ncbi:MAG: methylated-DNA--[protein]-cysteine S-methyltransferase [Actinomycetota bacterium]|nr:methylated-DNA--[protein]-cysteine S-methyltransferase [Actinomycetota bacterium]
MPLLTSSLKTPIGVLNLLADDQILIGVNLTTISAFRATQEVKSVKAIPTISDLINDYFDGDLTAINAIKVRQSGASFSQAAWKAMRKISAGKAISYADLAQRAGSTAAVRAAGAACANNAIMLVVPCHRIIKTGGALGNYAYGANKKKWLLSHEGFF